MNPLELALDAHCEFFASRDAALVFDSRLYPEEGLEKARREFAEWLEIKSVPAPPHGLVLSFIIRGEEDRHHSVGRFLSYVLEECVQSIATER